MNDCTAMHFHTQYSAPMQTHVRRWRQPFLAVHEKFPRGEPSHPEFDTIDAAQYCCSSCNGDNTYRLFCSYMRGKFYWHRFSFIQSAYTEFWSGGLVCVRMVWGLKKAYYISNVFPSLYTGLDAKLVFLLNVPAWPAFYENDNENEW